MKEVVKKLKIIIYMTILTQINNCFSLKARIWKTDNLTRYISILWNYKISINSIVTHQWHR